jgi:hypothetical protein
VKTGLQVLTERLGELGEVALVLGEDHALLDDVLANNLEDLVLLKCPTKA